MPGVWVAMIGRKLPVAVVAAALGLLAQIPLGTLPASACSCVAGTLAETAARADLIFTGTVQHVRVSHPGAPLQFSSNDPVRADMLVDTVYRGEVPAQVTVGTVASGASCGFAFQPGQRYTVFARLQDDGLTTGLCSGNVRGPIDPAIYGLTAGVSPLPVAQVQEGQGWPALWLLLGAVAAVVLGGALGLVIWRRGG